MEEEEIETPDPFYNCSECSSLIEIINLDDKIIEYKCFNKKNNHILKMTIEEYINKMKIHHIEKNDDKCMINGHYKENESYCLECNIHLCELCLKSRDHLSHNKINIKEILPKDNELKLIDNIIKDIENNNKYNNIKNLYEIIYNTYNKYNKNYYYCINMNKIILNYIENNILFKEKLSIEEYENIIKIKNLNKNNNQILINNLLDKNENYEKEINKLNEYNNNQNEISNLKKDNIKLSEEINELKEQIINNKNQEKINEQMKIKYENKIKNFQNIINDLKEDNKKLSEELNKFNNILSPFLVSLNGTKTKYVQMNNSICRIYNNKFEGIGFFTKIPFNNELLSVLMINNNIINQNDINNKIINIYLNNNKEIKKLKLDNRIKYTNKNITIIEIKNEDNINNKYIELDDEIINYFKLNKKENINYLNEIYSNKSIYLLNYHKDKNIYVSYIPNYHKSIIGSSGLPILLTHNQKLIGIHHKQYGDNIGTLLINSIIELNNLVQEKNNNYIIAQFNSKKDNEQIRIISSYEQYYRENIVIKYEKEYENEKEIKDNCKIIINNHIRPFGYFNKFNKIGKYNIKYIFKKNIIKLIIFSLVVKI